MNDDLDLEALLQSNLLQPPSDFTQRVMQRIQPLPQRTPPVVASAKAPPWRRANPR